MSDENQYENIGSMIARIDERTKAIQQSVQILSFDLNKKIEALNTEYKEKQNEIIRKLDNHIEHSENNYYKKSEFDHKNFITKESFNPIRNLNYGLIAFILTAVGGAILKLVIK